MNRLDTLEPDFKEKIISFLGQLKSVTGLDWSVTSARRTMEEQQDLYNQGRTTPGKIVTKAPPGSSPHNFGLAADLAPLHPATGAVWWSAPDATWKALADLAQANDLVAGYYFKTFFDPPHIEDPDWRETRLAWQAGKIQVA